MMCFDSGNGGNAAMTQCHCCGWYPKIPKSLGGKVRPKSLCVTLDGKDGISNAARVRTGAVIATRWRHAFSMVYDT